MSGSSSKTRRWLRWIAFNLAAMAGVFGLGVFVGVVQALKSGSPLWLRESAAAVIQQEAQKSDGRNAALLYWRAWDQCDFEKMRTEIASNIGGERSIGLEPSERRVLAAGWMRDAIEDFIEISKYEYCDFEVDYEHSINAESLHIGRMRQCTRWIYLDALRAASDGDSDGAVARVLTLLRMSSQLENDRTVIGSLASMAVAGLAADLVTTLNESAAIEEPDQKVIRAALLLRSTSDFGLRAALHMERAQSAILVSNVSYPDSGPDVKAEASLRLLDSGEEIVNGLHALYDDFAAVLDTPGQAQGLVQIRGLVTQGKYGDVAAKIAGPIQMSIELMEKTRAQLVGVADKLAAGD